MDLKKLIGQTVRDLANAADDFLENADDLLSPASQSKEPVGEKPVPVERKVLTIIYNPLVPKEGGRRLSEVLRWNDPDDLMAGHIKDLHYASYGYANYKIAERIEVDGFPRKLDGFSYTADTFLAAWRARQGFHQPDGVDYLRIVEQFDIIERVNEGRIDEVWLWGFPYAGYYESIMAGPGAFWCNAPPLENTDRARRRFVIMGYNYQRGLGEMLENMGHRAESIMKRVFRRKRGDDNLWERFARYDKTHPNGAHVGIMHYAPNSETDYDWGNKRRVVSFCDDWHNFPDFKGEKRVVDCREWGDGDIRKHHLWWYRHLPHITGRSDGVSYNWWEYIIDPNNVR